MGYHGIDRCKSLCSRFLDSAIFLVLFLYFSVPKRRSQLVWRGHPLYDAWSEY